MLRGGFELAYRLLSYPKPVVMACTGHAIAMGAFLLSAGDHRVAAHAYNIQANEVAIGMTLPYAALEIMKLRLTRSAYQQAAGLAKSFFGETAVAAGFVDEIVLPEMVLSRATEAAQEFAGLHQHAPRRDQVAGPGRRTEGPSRRDRRHRSRIRSVRRRRRGCPGNRLTPRAASSIAKCGTPAAPRHFTPLRPLSVADDRQPAQRKRFRYICQSHVDRNSRAAS